MPQELQGGGLLLDAADLTPDVFSMATPQIAPAAAAAPKKAGFFDVIGAAFEADNSVTSALRFAGDALEAPGPEEGYDVWGDIKGTPYEDYFSSFSDSQSAAQTATIKRRIDEENDNRRTLAAAGIGGFAASVAAGILDPTILIPVGGELKLGAQGTYNLTRSALRGSAAALAGTAIQEGALQATQETRSMEETAWALGGSVVLGGLLGGGSAALLNRGEQQAANRALQNLMPDANGVVRSSIGAAGVDVASLADLTPSGGAANAVASLTKNLTPNLRAQYRASPAARQFSQELAENTLYQTMHDQGRTLGAAAETLARSNYNARMLDGTRTSNAIFTEMRKAGVNMNRQGFEEAVGRAMRNGDVGDNDFISRAAQQWRTRVFEPFKNEAIDLGLLPADVSVDTAASYFTRVWNKERLTAQEPEFKDKVTKYYEGLIAQDHAQSTENLTRRVSNIDNEIADLRMGPEDRVRTLADLDQQGARLDAENGPAVDQVSAINDLRRQQRAAREAGNPQGVSALQAEIEKIKAQGGDALKLYQSQRRALRQRQRNVDLNYAGMNERHDAILQSLVDIEETNFRSLNRLVERGRKFEREMQRLDPNDLQAKVSSLRNAFADVAERADKAAERASRALAKMDEQAAKAAETGGNVAPINDAARARIEKEIAAQQNRAERMTSLARRLEVAESTNLDASVAEIRSATDALLREVNDLTLSRGEKASRLKERLARLDPAKIDERVKVSEDMKGQLQRNFDERWGARQNVSGAGYTEAAREIADDVFDKLTGRAAGDGSSLLPEYLTPITRGPLKERTFNIPDELISEFLDDNVLSVAERYGRTMAAETELTRRFGRADMRDQINAIREDYKVLRDRAGAAPNGTLAAEVLKDMPGALEEFTAQIGKNARQPSREKVLKFLAEDEKGAIRDLEAMRDLIRGTYKSTENASNYGRVVRSLMAFNYIRSMGGAVIANITELYRPAMVHGLGAYVNEGILPLMNNLSAVKLSVKEAQQAGQVTEAVLQNRLMSMGEVGDPYRQGTAIERMLQNGSRAASRWNGLAYWTDGIKAMSSILSQNRIIDGALKEGDTRFLAYLGIDNEMAGRIAEQFSTHGETMNTIKVANTENWTDPSAVRAYRAAVSKDVDSIVVVKGVGDVPLFANTPTGKLIMQFRNFTFASHQRVLLRGLQEDKKRFVSGMIGMSALGMLAATARSWRGGQDRFEKFKESAKNPGFLLAEGLDLSGIFALPVEIGNTVEKLTGPSGFSFNPVKTPLLAAGKAVAPETSMQGNSTRFAARDPLSAILGPSAGLPAQVARAAGAPLALARGEEVKASQTNAAIGLVPFGSYLGMREVLQATTGDSPYTGEPAP